MRIIAVILLLTLSSFAFGIENGTVVNSPDVAAPVASQPQVSDDASWVGVLLIVVLVGLFLPAAVIGPIVRMLSPEEVPPAKSHDEPPGMSGHHGRSGELPRD